MQGGKGRGKSGHLFTNINRIGVRLPLEVFLRLPGAEEDPQVEKTYTGT